MEEGDDLAGCLCRDTIPFRARVHASRMSAENSFRTCCAVQNGSMGEGNVVIDACALCVLKKTPADVGHLVFFQHRRTDGFGGRVCERERVRRKWRRWSIDLPRASKARTQEQLMVRCCDGARTH